MPGATRETLARRARILHRLREYFYARGLLEVEVPVLSRAGSPELHLDSLQVAHAFPDAAPGWLITSPEFYLKRLLAAGSGNVFAVSRVFRPAETGRWHNPEFTLVEWYRLGADLHRLMDDICALLEILLPEPLRRYPAERISYRDAFIHYAGIDPVTVSTADLRRVADPSGTWTRDELLDWIVSRDIYPRLGAGRISLVYHFPASQASLARLCPADDRFAERVEAIVSGIELVNGFVELTDPVEQRRRFDRDCALRAAQAREIPRPDEHFIAALESGLPACTGAALGFDRVVMLALGVPSITAVQAFPQDRA